MKLRSFYSIFLLAIIVACGSITETDENEEMTEFFANAEKAQFESVFKTVDQSTSGNTEFEEAEEFIFKEHDSFSDFWEDIHAHRSPLPEVPEIDFEQYTVVAVIMGVQPTGGYSVEVKEVASRADATGVKIVESKPGSGCMTTQALTMPFHIIKYSADLPEEVKFFRESNTYEC